MVEAAGNYVRVIVRRPHAYWFVQEHLPKMELASQSSLAPEGEPKYLIQAPGDSLEDGVLTLPNGAKVDAADIILIDASKIPIPGLVVLDGEGNVVGALAFLAGVDRESVLQFLRESARTPPPAP